MTAAAPSVQISTPGLHHVAIRCADLARARVFYLERLGFPLLMDADGLFIFAAGATAVAVRGPDQRTRDNDAFDPYRVGLDHLALGCTDLEELRRVSDALSASGINNTGMKRDDVLGKQYVAFKDPDGIAWEFYMT